MIKVIDLKNAGATGSLYRMHDGGGLYVEVSKKGTKTWYFKFRFEGKEQKIKVGRFPDISIKDARAKRDEYRTLVAKGIDPRVYEKFGGTVDPGITTFHNISEEWFEVYKGKVSENTATDNWHRLERHIFPSLGSMPISEIKPLHILSVLKKMEAQNKRHSAKRLRQLIERVFVYAVITGRCASNPASGLSEAMLPEQKEHFASLPPKELPQLIRDIYQNKPRLYRQTQLAMLFMLLTLVRTKELTLAKWDEIDGDVWHVPVPHMKMKRPHVIPLPTQAMDILEEIKGYDSPGGYIFPSPMKPRNHLSDNTILYGLYRLGYKDRMTGHGFRSLGMSAIQEFLGYEKQIIDVQLAHLPNDPLGAAYDRAPFFEQRKKMLQDWADYCWALLPSQF